MPIYIYIYIYIYIIEREREREREREVGGIRFENSSRCVGSNKLISSLNSPVYACNTEAYGFIEFEISNSTISTIFCQPLVQTAAAL